LAQEINLIKEKIYNSHWLYKNYSQNSPNNPKLFHPLFNEKTIYWKQKIKNHY
jgi:hypothetical protein